MSQTPRQPGKLFLVATPIGNLQDVSLRAIEVLGRVELIAAEDTRHSRKLLASHGIAAELISYREQNHARAAARILAHLEGGADVALISDAGMPGISDPGQALVATAVERGLQVVPVPGPCAAVSAVAASGLPSERFLFIGFLPRKRGALGRALADLAGEPGSLVFYESPRRVGKTLAAMAEAFGPRRAVVVRELTKIHETFDRGTLPELAERYADGARGEITLVVAGAAGPSLAGADDLRPLVEALRAGQRLPPSRIAALLAPLTDLPKRDIYALACQDEEDA